CTRASLDYLHVRCSAAELNGVSSEAGDSILSSVRQVGEAGRRFKLARLRLCLLVKAQEIIHCCRPIAPQTGKKPRIPPLRTVIADGYAKRLLLPDQHEQSLAPCDPRVDQVPLQQHVVLRCQRYHHRWKFRSL